MGSKRPPKPSNYDEKEMGSPLNKIENEVAKVRSTATGMSYSGQQTSAKNQTCDRGVWSWQDERIFLQELYSIMNSYNSMNIYQGGMINIKSNDRSEEDVCSNNDGGLMQNKEFDVCRVKSVERYASFPKHQKQMYDKGIHAPENVEEHNSSLDAKQGNNNSKSKTMAKVVLRASNSDGGKDKTVSSGGGNIKHGGQNNILTSRMDG